MKYWQTQSQEKAFHYEIPNRPWEVVGADVFVIINKTLLCTVDYHSKFPIVKEVYSLSEDDLVHTAMLIFVKYGILKKIISDVDMNFTFGTFKYFLQADEHPANIQIIIPPPKQWTGGCMCKIC